MRKIKVKVLLMNFAFTFMKRKPPEECGGDSFTYNFTSPLLSS